MAKEKDEPDHFRTNVLLKSIIGKDLINNDNIAVLELVKNSFDASSESAEIYFKNIKSNDDLENDSYSKKSSKIVIIDEGKGMGISDIRKKWLNIAYSEKKQIKEDAGRVFAGAKGIGRFSCDRLGRFLDIYSKKKNGEIAHLKIDWKKFELEEVENAELIDIQIQDIVVDLKEISKLEFAKTGHNLSRTGTIIEISRLRTDWDEDKIAKLRRYLERLINPNQSFNREKFIIELFANEFPSSLNGQIKNQIFDKLNFTTTSIEATISKNGKEIKTELRDKGRDIFTVTEINTFDKLSDVKIVIFFLNTYSKIYFARMTGISSVRFGSIFLFKNGFRVSPYGDEGDDWLGLEVRKGQNMRRAFATRDIVGRIEINDNAGVFQEVSSREGIVKNDTFLQLTSRKGLFLKTLRRLEKYVVDGLDWDSIPQRILDKANDKDFQNALSEDTEIYTTTQREKDQNILGAIKSILRANPKETIDLFVNTDLLLSLAQEEKASAEKILKDIEKYGIQKLNSNTYKAIVTVKDKLLKQKERQIRQLSKSIKRIKGENYFLQGQINVDVKDLISYHHHIGNASVVIEGYLTYLGEKIRRNVKISNKDLEEWIYDISLEVNKISTITNFATKAKFNLDSEVIEEDLSSFIEEYIENVSKEIVKTYTNELALKLLSSKKNLKFIREFRPIEITIIIDNLLKNSSKAEASKVKISIFTNKDELNIIFADNGHGVPKNYQDKIFDFGFTTTDGSGLGLYHVKRIMEEMKGTVRLNKKFEDGAEFILTFPK